jgi:anaerobic selenocysteine-containing dehydrogenase
MRQQRIPGYGPLCISRCGCISVVEDGVLVRVEPDPAHPAGNSLCIKAKAAPELVNSAERVLYPMKRTRPKGDPDAGWQRIGWDEALDYTASKMRAVAQCHGPESVAFSVTTPSGTAIADSVGWIFRLINAFGSPNAVWTSHVCNWHKDVASAFTIGADIGMPDYAHTGCIVYWGFNPAVCWPAQAQEATRAIKRGAKLVVVDPRRAGLAGRADQWLRLRPGTDGALALGIAGAMIAAGWYDHDFIAQWSTGPFLVRGDNGRFLTEADLQQGGAADRLVAWDEDAGFPAVYDPQTRQYPVPPGAVALFGEFEAATLQGPVKCRPAFDLYAALCREYPPERVAEICGVPAPQVEATAKLLHENGPVSFYAWSGVGQNTNATQTSRALFLLQTLTGSLDAPGGNVYFTKPRLNNILGTELLPASQRAKALGAAERPLGPARNGWATEFDLYRAILRAQPYPTAQPYPVKGLVSFGSNLLLSRPGQETAREALEKLDFYVHADLFLTPSAQDADVVLPVATAWEREGLQAGFMVSQQADAHLQLRPKAVQPLGEARSDTWIAFELAKRLGLGAHFFDGDIEAGLRHVLAPSGVTLETLREHPAGVDLPLETRYRKYLENGFATPSGRIEIYSAQLLDIGQPPLPDFVEPAQSPRSRPELNELFPLVLTSAKWVQYCHSQQRSLPMLRQRMPHPLAEIHPETAAAQGIAAGDWMVITSPSGTMRARARLNANLDRNVVCAQYGWWQSSPERGLAGDGDANYNSLIDHRACDPVSGSLALRSGLCRVEKLG